ncbi:LOW QUALITY PROTEIN: cell division control protein 6 homolog B-like [Pistacia vera]|uniref:LOW QUALITY PROTEIN: cell division control protein 6 homolog B-like n=1 Tax=Pistacia vera TaxID=55513 RepID=UPI0012636C0C|nr:LOW QUALITY PROTEIN: cell division control protein 6 homolog B-like [Pistacia vera]
MPAIASRDSISAIKSEKSGEIARSNGDSTPQKRRLRSDAAAEQNKSPTSTPMKWKSPRRSLNSSPNTPINGIKKSSDEKLVTRKSPVKKRLFESRKAKPNWNPQDVEQMSAVKEALHVSTAPSTVVCREEEQKRVLEFCKKHLEQEKAGSLYVCGCPGTGKSLSMEKIKQHLLDWAKEEGFQVPDVLAINCTSLTNTSEIFSKIIFKMQGRKKISGSTSPLQQLQNLYSQKQQSSGSKMMLIVADELDYLITRDRAVLHDLFMLTTFRSRFYNSVLFVATISLTCFAPFCFLYLKTACHFCLQYLRFTGIANAIDLADRFLPRLQSLNCKPLVVTFRAYSKDQIIRILQERLMALPYIVFQPQALELCARKVAAASGDMRKALSVCRSAIEVLDTELRESASKINSTSVEKGSFDQQAAPALEFFNSQVRVDHMAVALSNTFKSPVVDTIQSLPQHQQIILCSAVKFFRRGKKDTTVGELNKSYMEICKTSLIPPVGILEFSSMCRVLNDQGLLKLGQSREDKLKRVTLKIDESDITFALQGVRFFRNCLQ